MKNSSSVDALDLDIVDVLQSDPRVSWSQIAALVDRSEVSVARRWKQLKMNRLAWTGIALHPSASQGAFIEMRCWSSDYHNLCKKLCSHPDVVTVGTTTGDFNLYCIVIGVSLSAVLNRIDKELPELRLCERVRINLFHQITGGVDWRQGILDLNIARGGKIGSPPAALSEFHRVRNERGQLSSAPHAQFRPLFLAFGADARRPLSHVSNELRTSYSMVKRTLKHLVDQRQIVFRCDVAREAFDFPISMVLSLKVAPKHAEEVAFRIGAWKETRFCASVASTANLIIIAGLRDLVDGENFMGKLSELEFPLEVVQRSINTRMIKIYGRMLDQDGRALQHIAVDPWAGETVSS